MSQTENVDNFNLSASFLNEFRDFLEFLKSLWGILTGISVLFPLSNAIVEVIPIGNFHSDFYGLYFFSSQLITSIATLSTLFFILFIFGQRENIAIDEKRELHQKRARFIFLSSFVTLLAYLGLHFTRLEMFIGQELRIESILIIRDILLLLTYSSFFSLVTMAFMILGMIEYYKKNTIYRESENEDGKVSWKSIEKHVLFLIRKLRERQYMPDLIVGIGRSGGVIASMISGNMGIIPLCVIDRKYWWENGVRKMEIISTLNSNFIQGKKILMVMAETFSGETIKMCKKYLSEMKPDEIMTLVIFKGDKSPVTPDFYAELANDKMPVPWRITPEYIRDSNPPQ